MLLVAATSTCGREQPTAESAIDCTSSVGSVAAVDAFPDVEVGAAAPGSRFPQGQQVPIELRARNNGADTVALEVDASPSADFWISSGGQTIWRWSSTLGEVFFTSDGQLVPLAPGEAYREEQIWDQTDCSGAQVGPGTYELMGALLVVSEPGAGDLDGDGGGKRSGWFSDPVMIVVE